MVFGYIRVSTNDQNTESQKNIISRYCLEYKIIVDEWIEINISSRKSTRQRRIDELSEKIGKGDIIISSELECWLDVKIWIF